VHMRLGRIEEHDPRSLNYPAPRAEVQRSVLWGHHAPVLNQGDISACTGNATAQLINTDPFTPARKNGYLTEADALKLYELATTLDDCPGSYPPDDTGSSGQAVAQAGVQLGYFSGFNHAFGFDHFGAALQLQPVIVGTNWMQGMFTPDSNGFVTPTGDIVGGHEYLALGIDYDAQKVTFLNSWSDSWGQQGRFFMTFDSFTQLLNSGGDAVAPVCSPTA
jgi:hypothetical protein